MSQDNGDMTRRTALKGIGTAAVAATAGAGGLLATTGGAAATSFNFDAGDISGEFDDGDVEEVFIQPTGNVSWSNFDEEIHAIGLTLKARVRSKDGESTLSGWETIHTTKATKDNGGVEPGKTGGHSGDVGPNPQPLYSGDDTDVFDSEEDGEVNQVKVDVMLTAELLNEDGELADPADEAVLEDTATFLVTAKNLKASASGSADADPGMK